MKRCLLIVCAFVLPFIAKAQSCLTIFSEDGDRFYVSLNSVKQNPVAKANVRIDGLNDAYYSVKIVFEDGSIPELTKSAVPVKDPMTGQNSVVAYRIKKGKDGKPKLRYFGAQPVPDSYTPAADEYVAHYGAAPAGNATKPNNAATNTNTTGTTTQHTTTTTTTTGGGSNTNTADFSMGVGADGAHVNINVSDPNNGNVGARVNVNVSDPNKGNGGTTYTHTTTTTTTTSYGTTQNTAPADPAPTQSNGTKCAMPMSGSTFAAAKKTISGSGFDETKLSSAKSILKSNCVSTDQVIEICKLFGFEETKLAFAKFAFAKTTDQGNYFKVADIFSFDSNKTELNDFINQQ